MVRSFQPELERRPPRTAAHCGPTGLVAEVLVFLAPAAAFDSSAESPIVVDEDAAGIVDRSTSLL